MRLHDTLFDDHEDTVFRDVLMLALAGFMAIVILLLPHLNPPGEAKTQETIPPGNVIVETRWPDGLSVDVDLWVQGPGDVPVGYSNKGGALFNLLRDDLGTRGDATPLNYEVSFSRGVVPGDYVVNLHLYRNEEGGGQPVPANVTVSVKPDEKRSARQILVADVELRHQGQELTVFRFTLDEAGQLVPGSVHNLPKALRSGGKS
jgi:hypothetical protein